MPSVSSRNRTAEMSSVSTRSRTPQHRRPPGGSQAMSDAQRMKRTNSYAIQAKQIAVRAATPISPSALSSKKSSKYPASPSSSSSSPKFHVALPKRMLYYTLMVFLVIPIVWFCHKEAHRRDHGKHHDAPMYIAQKKRGHRERYHKYNHDNNDGQNTVLGSILGQPQQQEEQEIRDDNDEHDKDTDERQQQEKTEQHQLRLSASIVEQLMEKTSSKEANENQQQQLDQQDNEVSIIKKKHEHRSSGTNTEMDQEDNQQQQEHDVKDEEELEPEQDDEMNSQNDNVESAAMGFGAGSNTARGVVDDITKDADGTTTTVTALETMQILNDFLIEGIAAMREQFEQERQGIASSNIIEQYFYKNDNYNQ